MVEHRVSVPRLRSVRMKGGGASMTVLRPRDRGDVAETLREAAELAAKRGATSVAVVLVSPHSVGTLYHAENGRGASAIVGGLADIHHRIMVKRWGDDV